MSDDTTRELLVEAANRSASYLEGLHAREVQPSRHLIERLNGALDVSLPNEPSEAADVLYFPR